MEFVFDEAAALEAARIEDEAGCDIIAGYDLGANAGAYFSFVSNYGEGIDPDRLKDFLRQELQRFPLFDEADVDIIAAATLRHAGARLQRKFVPEKTLAEDKLDLQVAEARMADPDRERMSYDEFFAELEVSGEPLQS